MTEKTLVVNMDIRHRYARKYLELIESGVFEGLPKGKLTHVHIAHDDSCPIFDGGFCDCDADITWDVNA